MDIVKRFPATYDLLKCLLLHENPETRDYLEERRKRSIWQEDDKEVIQPLLQSNIVKGLGIADRINEDFLQHICGVWDVNSYEIRAPDSASMRGLYLNGSLMTHNCCPNTNQAIDDQYRIKLYANRDIAKNEIITISYTNLLLVSLYLSCRSITVAFIKI